MAECMRWPLAVITALALLGCGDRGKAVNTTAAARSPTQARKCLKEAGLRVLGGPRSPEDTNAPDVELIVAGRGAHAFVAFYDEVARAKRYEPEIRKHARRFHGSVERRGRVTLISVPPSTEGARTRIQACVF